MNRTKRYVLAALITAVIGAIAYYIVLPPLNVFSQDFWLSLVFLAAIYGAAYAVIGGASLLKGFKTGKKASNKNEKLSRDVKIFVGVIAVPILVLIVGNLISSTFFNAKAYSELITVEQAVFEEDMPESDLVTNIALMDSESAAILGKRALGELANADLESQFQIGDTYSQINLGNAPAKVGNLEYADFFRWVNNRANGVPGYVWVDPVDSNYKYVSFSQPIKYVESAYFSEDLNRQLRFSHPTKIFGEINFEVDEAGNPYYIVSCMEPRVGLFGAMDVAEVIIFNPVDGSSQIYALAETPSWVDNVFDGYLASQKYDWYGTLQQGFWNSVIGKKNCKVTTDDFGYIVRDDDVWYFTGVTSVSSDESNIGFLLSNARTGSYKFYQVIGAEEYSAMGAAEGEVQEKGYIASFPSLINVSGEATYIMVLKDANGIVKLHALVNVENYSIVATGVTQADAKRAYLERLKAEGVIENTPTDPLPPASEKELKTVEDLRIDTVQIVTVGGESVVYLRCADGNLYKKRVSEDERVLLLTENTYWTFHYYETDVGQIRELVSWEVYEGK